MKVNESGRSMIEMLGVLAIIGVLSVGGIAGYTKAMTQHKINKTVDQITHIVGNIRTLYFSQKNYSTVNCKSGVNSGCKILSKGHVIPDEMWANTDYTSMENPFGGAFEVEAGGKTSDDSKAFVLKVSSLPAEACMALATYDWGSGSSSGLIAVGVNTDISGSHINCQGSSHGNNNGNGGTAVACPKDTTVSVPMPADKAAVACADNDTNTIRLKFY